MICKSFQELTPVEKKEMIGKIQHLIQTNEDVFIAVASMIRFYEAGGIFKGIKFSQHEVRLNARS